MPSPETTAALRAAVVPIAAYVARTPEGNAHADRLATLVDAVADYVAESKPKDGPDWESIALRMARYIEPSAEPSPVAARTRAHLDSLTHRAGLTLAQRLYLASITSHHLHVPEQF